jgi:hypothetical protein
MATWTDKFSKMDKAELEAFWSDWIVSMGDTSTWEPHQHEIVQAWQVQWDKVK